MDSVRTSWVKQYSTRNDYTLWRFKETSAGNFALSCKATELDGNYILAIDLFDDVDDAERTQRSQSRLLHEISHQFDAPDHYHEEAVKGDRDTCINKPECSECCDNGYPSLCIMYETYRDIHSSPV